MDQNENQFRQELEGAAVARGNFKINQWKNNVSTIKYKGGTSERNNKRKSNDKQNKKNIYMIPKLKGHIIINHII